MPWNFWHWSVSDIDHRQIGACCACSKCGTFLFPFIGHCSLAAISGKDSSIHATSNSRSPFPHLCTEKLSRTCCACSRDGSLFLLYCIQPHLLSPLIMVRLKMTYLEIFSPIWSNTLPIVTSIVMLFHGFRSAVKLDMTLAPFRI